MALSGNKIKLSVTGVAIATVGEAVTAVGNLTYQITNTVKRVLSREGVIRVHKRLSTGNITITGTTTTTIKKTAHGLVTGDLIVNTTRASASRIVTKVDNDTLTVTAITAQAVGDSLDFYPTELPTAYTLDRLIGMVTYTSAVARVILISGDYLPVTEVAEAKEISYSMTASNEDVTVFGDTWVKRKQTLKDVTASVSKFYVDTGYEVLLTSGEPMLLEVFLDRSLTYFLKLWVVIDSVETSADPSTLVEQSLEFSGTADADGRVVSLGTGL